MEPECNVSCGSEDGQSLVEFAVCVPVMLLVVFGMGAFGIALSNNLMLEDATNVGARQLAISRGQTSDPCSTISSSVIAAAPNLVRANLGFTYVINGTTYSGQSCTSAAANMAQGATARVTVTYPCTLNSLQYSFGACTLTASTAELIQ